MQSTHILTVNYDSTQKALKIYFFGGGVHEFQDVPYAVYDDIIRAKSKGKYYNEKVKGVYQSKKVY